MKQIQTAAFGVPVYEPRREASYRPRILPRHLRRLWLLKAATGRPITRLVSEALDCYFETQKGGEK